MAYTGLEITTKVHSATLSITTLLRKAASDTTYNAGFYSARQASNDALVDSVGEGRLTFPLLLML